MPLNRPSTSTASHLFVDKRGATRQAFGQNRSDDATGSNVDDANADPASLDYMQLDGLSDDRARKAQDLKLSFSSKPQGPFSSRPLSSLGSRLVEQEKGRHEARAQSRASSVARSEQNAPQDDTTQLSVFTASDAGQDQDQDMKQVHFGDDEYKQSEQRRGSLLQDDEDQDFHRQHIEGHMDHGAPDPHLAKMWDSGRTQQRFNWGQGPFGRSASLRDHSPNDENNDNQSVDEVLDYRYEHEGASTTPSRPQALPPQSQDPAPKPPPLFPSSIGGQPVTNELTRGVDNAGTSGRKQEPVTAKRKHQMSATEPGGERFDPMAVRRLPVNTKTTTHLTSNGSSISSLSEDGHQAQEEHDGMMDAGSEKKFDADLDYDNERLLAMKYDELDQVSFSEDPRISTIRPSDTYGNPVPLAQKLKHLSSMNEEDQRKLFQSQTDDDWEQTGAWFIEMFASDLKRLMDARIDRRKVALKFEMEAKKRQMEVEKKSQDVQANLDSLKQGGHDLIKGRETSVPLHTPRKA